MSPTAQRVVGLVVLLVTGILSLPVAAYVLDGRATENWVLPVQLLAMALVGAALTAPLPALARAGAPPGRRAVTGAWWGLLAAFLGVLVFAILLGGLGGA